MEVPPTGIVLYQYQWIGGHPPILNCVIKQDLHRWWWKSTYFLVCSSPLPSFLLISLLKITKNLALFSFAMHHMLHMKQRTASYTGVHIHPTTTDSVGSSPFKIEVQFSVFIWECVLFTFGTSQASSCYCTV